LRRFFIPPTTISEKIIHQSTGGFTLHESNLVHRLTKVLRVQPKEKIILCDNTETEFIAEITKIFSKKIHGQILKIQKNQAEPNLEITILQALPKNKTKFEKILQHGTEVGITKFIPIISERTESHELRNLPRLQKILTESAELANRGKIPILLEPIKFTQALEKFSDKSNTQNFIADSFCCEPLLKTLLPKIKNLKKVNFWIGPEGGFSAREISLAQKFKVKNFSLGPRILRTETAGVAIASAVLFS
jgi:16S rRNA (uracil1498-N3)-methyltransferase